MHSNLDVEPTQLESKLIDSLLGLGNRLSTVQSKETWTKEIAQMLANMAFEEGYLQFPNDRLRDNPFSGNWEHGGEWLFDFSWLKARKHLGEFDWRNIDGLALACESEWTKTDWEILSDFLKLTLADADTRLFIYTNSKSWKVHPVELCKEVCPSKNVSYLLIGFPDDDSGMRVDLFSK